MGDPNISQASEKLNKPIDAMPDALGEAIEQMRAAGIPGCDYQGRSVDRHVRKPSQPSPAGPVSVHTVRMTNVIQRIREKDPTSPAAVLLAALPSVGALQGEVLCLALWGILQQDVLDTDLDSPHFQRTTDQLLLLLQAILESHPGPRASTTQSKIFRSLRNLLNLLPRRRRVEISKALRPLASHLLFPLDLLPRENAGSWQNVKAVLSKEITMPSLHDLRIRNDTGTHPAIEASEDSLAKMSLADKLRQDISLASIKSVLRHDLTGSNNIADLREDTVSDEIPLCATNQMTLFFPMLKTEPTLVARWLLGQSI